MKKFLFGFVWFVVFYIFLLLLVGIIHLILGEGHASFQEGYEAGLSRGAEFIESGGRKLIILISVILSGVLSFKGILPGTKE